MINLIAIITMLLDHLGAIFFPDVYILRILGRLSFPLFAWGITNGYRKTRSFKIYAIRLLSLAAISQIPYYILFRNTNLNICFTLLTGLMLLKFYDSSLSKLIKSIVFILIIGISQMLRFEYGAYGILTILLFHRYWGKESIIYYYFMLTLISIPIMKYDPSQLVACFSPIIILVTNLLQKNELKINKLFRYSFYPVHLLILFLIKDGGF